MNRSVPIVIVLSLQACLLFAALGLLPLWTDELFSLRTSARPVPEIIAIVQGDIHPPLYYLLLHNWEKLPLPWTGLAALRAFSALWALAATWMLDWFWARSLKPAERWLALALFAFSPCLLLYGRMARSYSMQTALFLLSLAMLQRWLAKPRSVMLPAAALVSTLALLYTHYVPGAALLAGFVVAGWRSLGAPRMAAFSLAVAVGYLPWMMALFDALRRWSGPAGFSATYAITGNLALEHIVKIGFGLVSLTIGESFLGSSLVLVPVILLLAVFGARTLGFPRLLLAVAALVGYLGVSRWVSYPFIPARLLWLLPYMSLAVAMGISQLKGSTVRRGVLALILLSYVSSVVLYFRKENFLNLGYTAPLPEIAAALNREAKPGDLILMDAYNTDFQALSALLTGRTPVVVLDAGGVSQARRRVPFACTVWLARNTRDISPGHTTTQLQAEACADRQERDTLLEPYAPWQQAAMKMAGIQPPLTHFYQLTECKNR